MDALRDFLAAADDRVVEILDLLGWQADVITPDGRHFYWSTHCRHGNHEACSAVEIAPGVPRRPAECKTCGSPCRCPVCGHSAADSR
jgi:hypothetical protein